MKIGIAGPIDLKLLKVKENINFPEGYNYPLTAYLINGLLDKGHQVVAYTLSGGIDKPLVMKVSDQLTVCIGRSDKQSGRKFFKTEIEDLRHLMQSEKPDIIHAHWTYEFALAAAKSGLPHVVTIHDNAFVIMKYNFDPYRFVRWIMNYQALEKANRLIANSDYIYRILSRKNRGKARTIYNFYPDSLVQPEITEKKGRKYLVTVSHDFNKTKNIENALKAFSILRRRHPDLQYYLIGSNMKPGGTAHQYATKHNLAEGVKFLGSQDYDMTLQYVSNAYIMVHPSREESFGMSVLEAMILGLPVVGGKKSGNIPYLLDHGKAGILCDIEKPGEIAEGVVRLLENNALYLKIKTHARQLALQRYAEKKIIEDHIAYYQDILNAAKNGYSRKNIASQAGWGQMGNEQKTAEAV